MSSPNIFAEDWQDCLHAHYVHVLRENDMTNESSLRLVLEQVGFDDAELASIRAEVLPDTVDLAPDVAQPEESAADAPAGDVDAAPDITAALGLDSAEPAATDEAAGEEAAPAVEEPPAPPPANDVKPTQMSLF